jgi:DNA-binding MarR family transcriptional regulator
MATPRTSRNRAARGASRDRSGRTRDAAEVVSSLRRLFKAIQEYSKAIFKRTGLSGPQVWALTILDREPGLSLNELSERLFAHPSTVSGIVDRLASKGAVSRVADPADRRGIRLSLTRAGRALLRRSPPPVQLGLSRALESLPPLQLRQLRRSLDQVVGATAARGIEATFFDFDPPATRSRRQTVRGALSSTFDFKRYRT